MTAEEVYSTTTEEIIAKLKMEEERSKEYGFDNLENVHDFIQSLTKMHAYRRHRLEKIETINIYASDDESFSWYFAVNGIFDGIYYAYVFYKTREDNITSFQIPNTCDMNIDELLKTIKQYESLDCWR